MDITRSRTAYNAIAGFIGLGLIALQPAPLLAASPIEFEDVTEQVGLAPYLEGWVKGHGAAWGDVTGNGRPELYIGAFSGRPVYGEPGAPIPNMLFLNDEDGFSLSPDEGVRYDRRDRANRRERPRVSMALFLDLNNNRKLDLLVGTHSGPPNKLFENRYPDTFRDVTERAAGFPADFQMRNATAIDVDQDGLLDLILIDGQYGGGQQRVTLLRNRGDFQFEDVSSDYGFPPDRTRGLGSAIGDVNHNGRLDLFVPDANRLFISQDDGTYVEYQPGFFDLPDGYGGSDWPCGAVFADLTGNGLLDLVFTVHGQAHPERPYPGHFFVYVNRGIDDDGMPRFENVTDAAGMKIGLPSHGKTGVGLKAADFGLIDLDNNGRRDILMGMVHEDDNGRLQPVVFRNTGVDRNGVPQFQGPPLDSIVGYYATAPRADYDRDGRVDIFMANWFPDLRNHLFRNVTDAGNHLVVRVEGHADDLNSMGVGATVRLYEPGHAGDDDRLLGRGDITLANGYSVGDEALAHFGLGERESCDVVVSWQGRTVTVTDVEANQYLTVPVGDE